MTVQPINEQKINTDESDKITFNQFGFRSAAKSQSRPDTVEGYLEIVYARFLEDQKLDEQGLKDRIAKLRAEVQQEKAKKQETIADVNASKRNKEDKEKEIETLELEKIDIRNGDGETGDTTPFVIGAFITLLLTLYLFVFYSSSGYSAFYGIKPGSLGFINPNVFADATNKGGGVITLIILFPVIFLGLGFLIHDALEKNKKLVQERKPRQFALIIILLTITFIADAFIGYKISEGVHTNDFNAGRTEELWKFNMIYTDINFYLVLILGFVVYVIWGFLLHYVLSHPYLKTESEKIKLMVENINNRVSEKRKELSDIIAKIHKQESDIVTIDNKIEEKTKDIIGYENGKIPINEASLRGSVGEFMGGWQNYTYGNYSLKKADELIQETIKRQNEWLSKKISTHSYDH
ncbi:hypothetical protein [Parasegetibacter sp. NRK P23]|uniref:hypothetical protein n=1 Tax=Parasegetibacter sp. NRK P23 TaxID=2942999 RepID=UPI0020438D5A|nr:hypothetical protein [Parasegetibacter sp. NRK P23]MCM5529775.1 hypothetical protein [Parasegetibacter sp. NRK P23]